jgi:hypothetical protein
VIPNASAMAKRNFNFLQILLSLRVEEGFERIGLNADT